MSHLSQLSYAYGKPLSNAVFRHCPEDFKVNEKLSFEPQGSGQHVFLRIQKRNHNTNDIATLLARLAGVKQVATGFAGLKDKQAVTTQWFSVDLAGQAEPHWSDLETDDLKVIEIARHSRKLKRGSIAGNHFEIFLRKFEGDRNEVQQRLKTIAERGVPNYFGEQRFGNNDYNLKKAEGLLVTGKKIKRHLRSIYLSSVRSFLFNQVLSDRVLQHTWNTPLEGDVYMLNATNSIFSQDQIDNEICRRVAEGDIHPTGPMWGRGDLLTKKDALKQELGVLTNYPEKCVLLSGAGMKQERRSLRLLLKNLEYNWEDDQLNLSFTLPAGTYATSVLREIITYSKQ